ncbi:MAG: indole-3-glycerol phosphate synthase TrpC [Candidatus Aceula lacicola]|nr:indole-3-glycerol phosphate synthase TrpC [Candidatus Aceula lacicola]
MNDFLDKILSHKKKLILKKKAFFNALKNKLKDRKHSRYSLFEKSISIPGKINLIAEIKKASPSRGLICKEFSVAGLSRKYVNSGAAAISVLTEDKFFLGKPPYVRDVSEHFSLPVLAKDFFIDEVQVYEAFSQGASAILLIVAILKDEEIKHLMKVAQDLDMDCLVEVHDEKEIKRAINLGARIIGINNRNLRTFKVDFKTCEMLIPKIPKDKVIVAESGIKQHSEIQRLKELGANAVLIGETFLRSADVEEKIREIMNGSN